ncbi:hypothetical protein C4K10_3634 [Pseudomonas chlororaphis subsp. aureofaciens]|nr:hypothetical protein C4K13_3797 [Pseudomonas chlororaphis subsp. aureofaciens]AZE11912.1 hypothetical protein C4K10_3634 [Pseudomonas chlororaphis subsp. aureofaciens]AZE36717.1 hypothetical protein C4K06_3686 [Pseudomonas chlororaphis subsp. aureofaciens]
MRSAYALVYSITVFKNLSDSALDYMAGQLDPFLKQNR